MWLYGIIGVLGVGLVLLAVCLYRVRDKLERTRIELQKADEAYDRLRSRPQTAVQDQSREVAYLRVQLEMRTRDLNLLENEANAVRERYLRFDQTESAYRMKISLLENEAQDMRRKLREAADQMKANDDLYQTMLKERDETIEELRKAHGSQKKNAPRKPRGSENQMSIEDLMSME